MSTEPLFWYRPRTDGGYEGPLHNGQIEDVRKASGAWVPLFAGAAPVSAEPVAVPDGWKLVPVGPTAGMLQALSGEWHSSRQQEARARYADMLTAAPVAAQPDVTQQTLDDVRAGIPARDAEIEALRKEIEALQAAPVKPYSLDLDPAGIRALTADAISGALALGFQGVSPPPNNEHWLAPFWEIGRESAVQAQQPVSGADRLPVKGDPWSGWACQHPGKLPRLYGDKAIAELNHHPEEGDRLFQLAECTQQDADKVDAALAEMVHAMFRSGNSVPVTRITIDRKQYDAAIDAARKEPGQ
ncbi:hypothetical protein [Alcaligenes aquatilis]|uniref:hypothetical protein n=1 Tax=Alcaligenes aquatilis TaxID=323284 RepID=UPI000D52DF72|nr:hypothetical protein [Alcaligenes aquatilis]AWG33984.1 hypothetical protein CA948_02005 [Alcaligenes aquatilis]